MIGLKKNLSLQYNNISHRNVCPCSLKAMKFYYDEGQEGLENFFWKMNYNVFLDFSL